MGRKPEGSTYEMQLAGYAQREKLKFDSYEIVENEDLPLADRVRAQEAILEARYWRSAEARHPLFSDYVAMTLNQEHTKEIIPEAVYKALVRMYGKKPGMSRGSYYGLCK